jgi:hypothetical protein
VGALPDKKGPADLSNARPAHAKEIIDGCMNRVFHYDGQSASFHIRARLSRGRQPPHEADRTPSINLHTPTDVRRRDAKVPAAKRILTVLSHCLAVTRTTNLGD